MTVNRTTLLDLPLPVSGTESGTWGDTTNNGLTQYMDIAIAGMSNLTSANFTAGALTIQTTEGTNLATNIVATSAQYAGFRVTSLATNSTITVGNTGTSPARSYRLINADSTYTLTFKATGQTGVTLQPGETAVVAFNGTDYVFVGAVGPTVPVARGGTGQTTYTDGQLLIGNTTGNTLTKATLTAGSGISITNGSGAITIASTATGTVTGVTATSPVASSGGTAPVISLSSGYGDTLNPYASKTANYILAAPNGSSGVPTFRALVAADVPTLNQNTTGSAGSLSSTLAVSSGGTGQTTYTDGQLLIGNTAGNTLTKATLTAGSGVSITNGSGAITIAATGSGGTVTSVGMSVPSFLSVAGSPITSSGTLAVSLSGTALPVANGGTGLTSAPANGALDIGNGSGFTRTTLTAGSGVSITNGSGAITIAATGSGGTVTSVGMSVPSFLSVSGSPITSSGTLAVSLSGTALPVANGGTGQTTYTDGQLLIGNTTGNTLTKATLTAGSGISITNGSGAITIAATGSGGTVTGVTATSPVASSGGTAPVISLNSGYGDTLNPYASKTANYILAAPNGSSGVPTFRALVAADIPTLNQNTTGSAGSLSSTLAVSSGGTGQTTYTDGQLLIGNTTGNTLTKATLTAGSGISITNGSGAITIAATGSGGTVTSVGMTVPSFLSVSGSPITSSGTLAVSLSGTALPVANGGTGATTLTGVLKGNGTSAFTASNVNLASEVTGTLGLANGGIGATSLASASIATYTGTETLTNKRVDPRTITTASTATLTPDISADDQFNITALAGSLTVAAPIGTPVDGNKIIIRILDNGTTRTISWNATYTAIGVTLPTATTAGKMLYVGCIYNATNTRWDVVALAQQA